MAENLYFDKLDKVTSIGTQEVFDIHETSNHGMYELPGGKPDGDETMVQTAIKETYEESGLNVKIIKTLEPHIDSDMKKVYH